MLSLIVSSAVARVRMIVHCEGGTPAGQAGATSGVVVAPSSVIVASAAAGTSPQSATAPTVAIRERFMFRFNTTPRRQLRRNRTAIAILAPAGRVRYCKAASPAASLELGDVDRLRPLRTGLLLIRNLDSLGQRAIAVPHDASEMNEQVAPAVIGRDEAEALVVAEPLDGTRCHVLPLDACYRTRRSRCQRAPTNPGKVARNSSAWLSGVIRCNFPAPESASGGFSAGPEPPR